jgi:hypothetical protein
MAKANSCVMPCFWTRTSSQLKESNQDPLVKHFLALASITRQIYKGRTAVSLHKGKKIE